MSISKDALLPLYDLLKGMGPSDKVTLMPEQWAAFSHVQRALDNVSLKCFSTEKPLALWLFTRASLFSTVLTQEGEPIEWVHSSVGNTPQADHMADAIIRGRTQAL